MTTSHPDTPRCKQGSPSARHARPHPGGGGVQQPGQETRRRPHLTLLLALLAVVVTMLSVSLTAPAGAVDGRVPDGRAATPAGELTAYYWHGLNRDPDAGGLDHYLGHTNQDCRWGLQSAATSILDSPEAHAVWRNDPATLAGALYAALLNRPPDPGGQATYTQAIAVRGMRWATTMMLASGEYQQRLGHVCAGRPSTNATAYDPRGGMLQSILLHNGAGPLVKACGVELLSHVFSPTQLLAGASLAARLAMQGAALAAKQVMKVSGSCMAAYRILSAANDTAQLASYEGANNPVFLQIDTRTYWNWRGRWCDTTVRMGPSAVQWDKYQATYRCWGSLPFM